MKQQIKAVAKKEVKAHEKKMHGMKRGGNVKNYAEGGNVGKKYEDMTKAEKEKVQLENARKRDPKAFDMKKSMYDSAVKKKASEGKGYAKGGGIEVRGKTKCKYR
jgi:hypothetical protein